MRKAVIDIGTNSTKIAIAEVVGTEVDLLKHDVTITRLGEGIGQTGEIAGAPLLRTVDRIKAYVELAKSYEVEALAIIGTSALRDAENKDAIAELIQEETGYPLHILSGEQEGLMSYRGATSDFAGVAVVIDIGGGSTEVVYPMLTGLTMKSVNIGSVRLLNRPDLCANLPAELAPLFAQALPPDFRLVAVGGTATSFGAMLQSLVPYQAEVVHGYVVTKGELEEWRKRLASMSLAEKQTIPGLMPERADVIDYGLAIMQAVMVHLGLQTLTISAKDLLYGLLVEEFPLHI